MSGLRSLKDALVFITNSLLLPITIIGLLLYILYSGVQYNIDVRKRLVQSTLTTLSEITSQQQFSFNERLSADVSSLKSVAYSLMVFGYSRESILEYLNVIESYHFFENLTVLDEKKAGVISSGEYVDFSKVDFFDSVLEGNTLISTPQKSLYSDRLVVLMATPILENEDVVGLVAAEYPLAELNAILNPPFEASGYVYVVNAEGTILARSHNDYAISTYNLFETLDCATYENSLTAQQIKDDISKGGSGRFSLILSGETHIVEYRALNFEGFSLIVAVPESILAKDASFIISEINVYNTKLLLVTLVVLLVILFFRNLSVKAIERAAFYDSLTGIPNLAKFKIDAEHLLKMHADTRFTIVKLDIVNFKSINDFYDFGVGDKVIKAVAETGMTVTDPLFLQARIGHDEFLLFCTYDFFKNLDTTRIHFEGVFRSLVPEIAQHNVTYRYGRYTIENNDEDINAVINKVLLAHSYAKTNKETVISDYDEEFKKRVLHIAEISNKQEIALKNNEFQLYLQPKCNMSTGKALGAEALVRWQEQDGSMIFPNDFIPIFEHNSFILQLDMYMLEQVCKVLKDWKDRGLTCIPISVNFSRLHLNIEDFVERIDLVAQKYQLEKHLIEIELTESVFFDNEELVKKVLADLHDRGFSLSMDDFGTGYSSLGLLQSLPVDTIKMDRSFFAQNKDTDDRARVIVASVAKMAEELGVPTVAEGVETIEQVQFLQSVGCDIAQGYYYGKPIPVAEFEAKWLN